MSTLLHCYTDFHEESRPVATFESKVGAFTVTSRDVTSQTYDERTVTWLVFDEDARQWYIDWIKIGLQTDEDSDRLYVARFEIVEKEFFTQPVMSELGPDLKEKLDAIDLKLSAVLNRMDDEKEREELALARMSQMLHGNLDVEAAIADILDEYSHTVLLEPEEAAL